MYSTNIYSYLPRQIVVVYNGLTTGRYQLVYSKNLKLHLGTDNILQFQFLNPEQKPINLTNSTISIRILSGDNASVILQKALTPTFALTGLAELRLAAGELLGVNPQLCHYSLVLDNTVNTLPVFTNQDSYASGSIEIVNDILPNHNPSTTVTLPSHLPPNNNTVTVSSSVINTKDTDSTTIQVNHTNYTGNVIINGSSTGALNDWYVIDSYTYAGSTASNYYVTQGYHPYIQLQFNFTDGTLDKILSR